MSGANSLGLGQRLFTAYLSLRRSSSALEIAGV